MALLDKEEDARRTQVGQARGAGGWRLKLRHSCSRCGHFGVDRDEAFI